jgi:DNA topoisomerase I
MARRGWRRAGSGRRARYLDAGGREIRDPAEIQRIEALAIPPAWRDVWISPGPTSKLQATGLDDAGRRQYLYHPRFRAAREREKFDRLVRFGEALPALRKRMPSHLRRGPFDEEWACAIAVTLVNRAWFRVGSETAARSVRTYGVTTLRKGHVEVAGRRVRFRFRAKGRVLVRTTVTDPVVADGVRALLELPGGSRLFRFECDGETLPLTARRLNTYLARHLGEGLTTKDFRTWGGTLEAAVALTAAGPAPDGSTARRSIAAAMRRVGRELGNTPAVARSAYVSPAVVDEYLRGRTLDDYRPAGRGGAAGAAGLSEDERALLRLLSGASV